VLNDRKDKIIFQNDDFVKILHQIIAVRILKVNERIRKIIQGFRQSNSHGSLAYALTQILSALSNYFSSAYVVQQSNEVAFLYTARILVLEFVKDLVDVLVGLLEV
jgi:hypothetical protein